MSDFSVTSLFVVSNQNATIGNVPTTGSTNNLVPGQLGIFLPDNTPATTATVGNAKYIYFAQGRNVYAPGQGTRKSDFIYNIPGQIINWYSVQGGATYNVQISNINNISPGCQQDFSVTFRLSSKYIDVAYFNGLTRTVMVTTPCCNCGSNPCDTLTAAQIGTIYEQLGLLINADEILSQYVQASVGSVDGSGNATSLNVAALPLNVYGQGTSPDLTNFPYQYDRVYFWTYLMEGPNLTTDYEVADYCNPFGNVTILQRASYPQNTAVEVMQLEKDLFSYQASYPHIFSNVNYNGEFQSYVDSTQAYTLYYIQFWAQYNTGRDVGTTRMDETVIVAIPTDGAGTATTQIPAILTAFLGAPDSETTNSTSSTSTSTTYTSTTTSTTTYVTP